MYGLNAVRVMLTSTSSAIATRRRRITSTVTGSSAAALSGAWDATGSTAAINVDLLEPADRERIAWTDQRARPVFLDQRRSLALVADRQRVAIEDRRFEEAVLLEKEDRPLAQARRRGMAVALGEPGELRPRHVQRRERMQHHELGVRRRIGMAVAALILRVELRPQRRGVRILRQCDLER